MRGIMGLVSQDVHRCRALLRLVESEARGLPWASERPWSVETHIHAEHGLLTIDLHDLNAALTKRLLGQVVSETWEPDGGGVIFITGRGRHSVGLPVLQNIVLGTLVRAERRYGWRVRDIGAGRILLVTDEARVPARYRAEMPLWIPLFFLAFGVALAWALPLPVGLPLLGLIAWFALRATYRVLRPAGARSPVSREE